MKEINLPKFRSVIIIGMLVMLTVKGNSQTATPMPEELNKSTLKEQLNYLDAHTRIYENYRAIREDMFQKIKRNATDTLSETKMKIAGLNISYIIIKSQNRLIEKYT